ncbi:MAG: protein phosphatase 2C domain-containing protein [Candidatus Gracilibacteria bacterium]|nr:protein phosphatase 2C domain-containing protein [Candidatus Gracilibacteria bacterium]
MKDTFEIAFGSIVGTDHTKVFKNNQDAYAYKQGSNYIVACVADGCSAGIFSEFGARFAVNFFVNSVSNILQSLSDKELDCLAEKEYVSFPFFDKIRLDMLSSIRVLANSMGNDLNKIISDFFLFTLVAVLITPFGTDIVSIGDGYAAINGEEFDIDIPVSQDSSLMNAPPYMVYNLVHSKLYEKENKSLNFRLIKGVKTTQLDSLLIATDGVSKWSEIQDLNIPAKSELVGPLSQFWTDDKYFSNQDLLRRKLFLMNNPKIRLDRENDCIQKYSGLLNDDTTIIAIRRKT